LNCHGQKICYDHRPREFEEFANLFFDLLFRSKKLQFAADCHQALVLCVCMCDVCIKLETKNRRRGGGRGSWRKGVKKRNSGFSLFSHLSHLFNSNNMETPLQAKVDTICEMFPNFSRDVIRQRVEE
jgi:hypothetical protein